ncbi:hypothetical protein [Dactylosporangium sp. CA-233914]|uniref:hypothetical protein n=1 Tax=Dactylosporangium sp. CA-233914 TaxID=3239934 RepID=UPI003D8A8D3B
MSTLLAGASAVNINPPLPVDPQGFLRRAEAVRRYGEPLMVTACVLDSGSHRVAVLAADVVGLSPLYADRIRARISEATGIAPEHILLNSSHTHAAPWPREDGKLHGEFPEVTPAEAAYFERLPHDYATAALLAATNLVPARVSGGTGRVTGLSVNRRERREDGATILGWNKEGFVDEDVPVIRVDALDGSAIATIVGFGCHPVCVGPERTETSPDFVGGLRGQVERLRGGVCVFLQGAAGNVLPLQAFCDYSGPELEMGSRLGLEAVHAVADREPRVIDIERIGYGSVTPIVLYRRRVAPDQPAQELSSVRRVIDLPLQQALSRETMEAELDTRRSEYDEAERGGAGRDVLNPIRYHIRWLESMLRRLDSGPLPTSVPGEVWAARIGDCAIVGTPGELFSELGAEVRAKSPFATTIFAGYSQGTLGYVATSEEYPYGGYEPTVSQRGYDQPAPFTPEVGGLLVRTSLELLHELHGEA